MLGLRQTYDTLKQKITTTDQGMSAGSTSIPSNKQLLARVKEISSFLSQQMEDSSFLGRNELKQQFSSLLKEVLGWYDNPNNSIISYLANDPGTYTTEIVTTLDSLLVPKGIPNLVQFALETRKDAQTEFLFPIDALPKHTRSLLTNRVYDFIPEVFNLLSVPLFEQINSIERSKHLILNSWEFYLFTFFSKISRMDQKYVNHILTLSVTKHFPDISSSEFLSEQLATNFDLYLFSKYYLYVFEQAKYTSEHDLSLFTNLVIEYFINPVNTVQAVNRHIEMLNEEETRKKRYIGSQGAAGTEFNTKSNMIPMTLNEEPQSLQLMFLHAAAIIMKDQWKAYLRFTAEQKAANYDGGISIAFFRGIYHWFKTLLTEKPALIQGKLFNIGCIYLTIIMPEEIEGITTFDHFISLELDTGSKTKSTYKPTIFESLVSGVGPKSAVQSTQAGSLCLEKMSRAGRMDDDSFTAWIKTFLVFYTDTLRDFVHYLAETERREPFDYLFITTLSELYREEGGYILKDWIELYKIAKISRGINREDRDILYFIDLMGAHMEWVDPFSHDAYFNKKLNSLIESLYGVMLSVPPTLPKNMDRKMIDACFQFIENNMRHVQENFVSLALCSEASKYQRLSLTKGSNREIDDRKVQPFEKSPEVKKELRDARMKVHPFRKKKQRMPDYDADWRKPCSREENIILYFIFYYLSYLVDKIRGIEIMRDDGKLLPPKTNLRCFAKFSNITFVIIAIVIAYYLLFKY